LFPVFGFINKNDSFAKGNKNAPIVFEYECEYNTGCEAKVDAIHDWNIAHISKSKDGRNFMPIKKFTHIPGGYRCVTVYRSVKVFETYMEIMNDGSLKEKQDELKAMTKLKSARFYGKWAEIDQSTWVSQDFPNIVKIQGTPLAATWGP
jgi:hypothetical protein